MAQFNGLEFCETTADEASRLSENVLISAAQAGQKWAFVELCNRHSRRILLTLLRITRNREDAEDALQDSILNAVVNIGGLQRASSFRTWLTRIGINSALMLLRRRRARPEISTNAPVDENESLFPWEIVDRRPNPEDLYIQLEDQQRLQTAISKLPEGYRRLFEIRQRSDASMKEIAEEAGIEIAATKSRFWRARQVLRNSMFK